MWGWHCVRSVEQKGVKSVTQFCDLRNHLLHLPLKAAQRALHVASLVHRARQPKPRVKARLELILL